MKPLYPVAAQFALTGDDIGAIARGFGQSPAFVFCRRDAETREPTYSYVGLEVERVDALGERPDGEGFAQLDKCLGEYALERRGDLPPFQGGVLAFFSHEATQSEAVQEPYPKYVLLLTRIFVAIDHRRRAGYLVKLVQDPSDAPDVLLRLQNDVRKFRYCENSRDFGHVDAESESWQFDTSRAEHSRRVRTVQAALRHTPLQQAVLSIGMSRPFRGDPLAVFEQLHFRNPSPHSFYLDIDGFWLAGATPLNFLTLQDGTLLVETDAGTRAVGTTPEETQLIARNLMTTQKDIDEQRIIADATIADLRAVATDGRVETLVPLQLRQFSHVMHLFTVFSARLVNGISVGSLLRSCFPSPATCGAPRQEAKRLYRALEGTPRGPYGGVIGLIDFSGNVDSAVILRSVWFANGMAYSRNGGGIVAESDPDNEYEECLAKGHIIWDSVAAAELDAP
jgi:anthranilate synthase component 1